MQKYWKEIIITLLTTGFIGQIIGVWDINVKREDSYIEKYIGCQTEIVELNRKIDLITNRLATLELASAEIPFPYWVKDRSSYIIYINNEYKENILQPLGIKPINFLNTQGEVLGKDFKKEMIENDNQVINSKKTLEFKEKVPKLGNGTSYKFPIYNNFGIVIGTGGIWIPDNIILN